MGRDFSALNKYGHREYKFAQSDSYRQVDNWSRIHSLDLSGGVCMGTTLNWVKEKLTTSNGLLRSEGPLLNPTSKRFSNPLNPVARLDKGISPPKDSLMNKFINKNESKSGPRNESTMAAGAMTQAAYEQNISRLGLTVGTRRVTEELGLVPGTHEQYPVMTKGEDNLPKRAEDQTIAAAGGNLPRGNAIVIELNFQRRGQASRGHAVAFYRSRGGTLYFFDPNAGVYKVFEDNLLKFVQAWLAVYVAENKIRWKTKEDNWNMVFSRTRSR